MATSFGLDLDVSVFIKQMIPGATRGFNLLGGASGKPHQKRLKPGTGYGRLDTGYARITGGTPAAPTIAASGNADFDVAGTTTDVFGTAIGATTKLIAIIVVNFNTAGSLTVRHSSATPVPLFVATGTQPGQIVQAAYSADDPGYAIFYAPSGFTVVGGASDLINLLNNDSSNAANYAIGFVGRTA
jgi:hypothetical protein